MCCVQAGKANAEIKLLVTNSGKLVLLSGQERILKDYSNWHCAVCRREGERRDQAVSDKLGQAGAAERARKNLEGMFKLAICCVQAGRQTARSSC